MIPSAAALTDEPVLVTLAVCEGVAYRPPADRGNAGINGIFEHCRQGRELVAVGWVDDGG